MGLWIKKLALADGEEVQLELLANHSLGKRAVGGKLVITSMRIVFLPNRLDAATGGQRLEITRDQVESVGVQTKDMAISEAFSGAWRDRLAIYGKSDPFGFFVVNNAQKAVDELKGILG
ncbi:MAG: hypothetical protein AAF226_11895 [Verrucomicrobiota bacterium]